MSEEDIPLSFSRSIYLLRIYKLFGRCSFMHACKLQDLAIASTKKNVTHIIVKKWRGTPPLDLGQLQKAESPPPAQLHLG